MFSLGSVGIRLRRSLALNLQPAEHVQNEGVFGAQRSVAMKRTLLLSAVIFLVAGFASSVEAQVPPPPPPPPPDQGPVYAPPPPPVAYQCGVYPAPPCVQPYYRPVYYRPVVRYPQPSFWNLGPYVGVGAGGFAVLGAKGPYEYISNGGFGNIYIGMNFLRRFALELGFLGSVHNEEWTYEPQALMMWAVTLDAKFNLVRPSWNRRFVPFLQAGLGAYGLVSDHYYGSSDVAQGGGFQVGGGIDIYLARWLTLGGRLLYRGIVMGQIKDSCGERCISSNEADQTYINGLTGEINMSIVF